MLPTISFNELSTAAGRERLREVTHDVGFFYLTDHGVLPELIAAVRSVTSQFFALPDSDKQSVAMIESPHFRGYNKLGGELTGGKVDWREQIDIGPDRDPVDGGPDYLRLQGPNQWPKSLPALQDVITAYLDSLSDVGLTLLRNWALSLGAPANTFDAAFATAPATLLKLVRYPARPAATDSNGRTDQGVGAHKDSGVLTLLLLEDGSSGLQVLGRDGSWIEAPAVPGAYVVNIGELLEVATGGYLRATQHRVVTPPGAGERISIPYFFNPALDATIPSIALPTALAANSYGVESDPDNPLYDTYGQNAWKSRTRAHPDVYQRWHAPSRVAAG